LNSPTTPTRAAAEPAPAEVSLAAIMPVYNEAGTIEEMVRRLEAVAVVRQIVVVDDSSDDGTRDIIRRLADAGRVDTTFHPHNRGKGAALRSGLELVRQPYLVIQDGDLEYDPQDFYAMAEVVRVTQAEVVYGSRFMGRPCQRMLWSHYLGNRTLTLVFNLLYGQRLTDVETCYKLFNTQLLRRLGIDNDRFDVDPELTAKAVRAGARIVEVPVCYVARAYLAGKKIRPRDALSATRTLWHYRRWRP
jgi:glycosyltransferase involved in cell wall biosynthesis